MQCDGKLLVSLPCLPYLKQKHSEWFIAPLTWWSATQLSYVTLLISTSKFDCAVKCFVVLRWILWLGFQETFQGSVFLPQTKNSGRGNS